MLSQKEFVEGCYNWYCEADLQPGNPEDGNWEEAHYPVPKCKGGTETILLLREHHAVQGVIQSEELQWRCIWGWEEKYLEGEYLELFNKWMSEGMKLHWENKTEEEKILWGEKCRDAHARRTEEEKKLCSEKMRVSGISRHARMTEEEKILWAETSRATAVAQHARMTEAEKILRAERHSAKMIAYHARRRERQAQELLARWKEGVVRECIL